MQPHPARLLTSRVRIACALGLTALIFAQAIRGLLRGQTEPGWFLGAPLLQGWALIAVNVFIYAYVCWLAFWFARGTAGRERVFMVGWFVGILLLPLRMLRPDWAVATKYVSVFGWQSLCSQRWLCYLKLRPCTALMTRTDVPCSLAVVSVEPLHLRK